MLNIDALERRLSGAPENPNFPILYISKHAPNLDHEGSGVSSGILKVLAILFSSFIAKSWERFVMLTKQL
jgi:hypothetical protein